MSILRDDASDAASIRDASLYRAARPRAAASSVRTELGTNQEPGQLWGRGARTGPREGLAGQDNTSAALLPGWRRAGWVVQHCKSRRHLPAEPVEPAAAARRGPQSDCFARPALLVVWQWWWLPCARALPG